MTTIELELCKSELAREILNTDNVELINTLRRAAQRFAKRQANKTAEAVSPCQYTVEQVRTRATEAMGRYERGEYITNEEMISNTQRWK